MPNIVISEKVTDLEISYSLLPCMCVYCAVVKCIVLIFFSTITIVVDEVMHSFVNMFII